MTLYDNILQPVKSFRSFHEHTFILVSNKGDPCRLADLEINPRISFVILSSNKMVKMTNFLDRN